MEPNKLLLNMTILSQSFGTQFTTQEIKIQARD